MNARDLRGLLVKLCGEPERQRGSHASFRRPDGAGAFTFAYHDRREVSATTVRRILVEDVGLTADEAERAVRKGKR